MTLLTELLRANRRRHRFSITHLSYLLGCSRPQYERMERGDNRFKPHQLVTLAAIYSENPSLYIDLQDVSLLLDKADIDEDPERAKRLLIAALQCLTTPENCQSLVVDSLTDDTQSETELCQTREQSLKEIISTQKQRLWKVDAEIKRITQIICGYEKCAGENTDTLRRRLNVLTDESTSLLRLIDKLSRLQE